MKLTIDSSTITEQITPFGNATTWSIQLFDENDNVITVTTGDKQETIDAAVQLAATVNTHPENEQLKKAG
jgi:hypothetical protein